MRKIVDDPPHDGVMLTEATWVVSHWDCENVARWFRTGVKLGKIPSTIRDLMLAGFCLLFAVGCSSPVDSAIASRASELSSGYSKQVAAVSEKQDATINLLNEHTTALAAIKSQVESLGDSVLETRQAIGTMEASLVKSTPNGKDGDPASALEPQGIERDSPNTPSVPRSTPAVRSSVPVKMSWNIDGNWNPTIIETANHLRDDHGVNIDGMTHQQLHDLHASLHNGTVSKPVAMKSYPVQIVNQGTYCPNGQCPMPRQIKAKRRR